MKKILLILVIVLASTAFMKSNKTAQIKKIRTRVLREYKEAYPDEEIYFVYGPHYNNDRGQTNIRYRAVLSSKRLEELDYYNGFQINFENAKSPIDTRAYQWKLNYLEVYAPLKREAKQILGENIVFEIEGTYTSGVRKVILENLGNDLPIEEKTGFSMIIFTTFVDDLDKEIENIELWKEKMYQLGKRYWEHYNVLGALQLYIYDRELLNNYDLVKNSLLTSTEQNAEISEILEKLENGENINIEDERELMAKMRNGKRYYGNHRILLYIFTNNITTDKEFNRDKLEIDFK